jgi:Tol biopolymer transport system component
VGEPQEGSASAVAAAFVGKDGNIWVIPGTGEEPRQVTQDAYSDEGDRDPQAERVQYSFPQVSSDGRLVAYRRDAGTPVDYGLEYKFGLWVTDLESGESRQVLDELTGGFSWKPGTHQLAYSLGADDGYFSARGQTEADLAKGIWMVDLDGESLEPTELVPPSRGYHLVSPVWSPDGRFVAFDEVNMYEGRGLFAYYQVENGDYVPWEEAIGIYSWSPDGEQIVYDRLTYAATGEERIFVRERQGGEERQISPDFDSGYAFNPVFSPQGDRIAYLAGLGGPDSSMYTLYVQDLAGGEAVHLGEYEAVQGLTWTPDGTSLAFVAGPFGEQRIHLVSAEDGTVRLEF